MAETLVGANFFKKSRPWADLPDFLIIGCGCIAKDGPSTRGMFTPPSEDDDPGVGWDGSASSSIEVCL